MKSAAIVLCAAVAGLTTRTQAPTSPPTFSLYFLGHHIGYETDSWSADGRRMDAVFHFDDRGTAIDVTATVELDATGKPIHLVVKGRNYRLFSSDSEVSVAGGRAHVRDRNNERDIDLAGKPFFPIDNYAAIGVQEALIKYWMANGKPAEITAAPSGPVQIRARGAMSWPGRPGGMLERLAVDGVVWGTEAAYVDAKTGELVAIVTWTGALPFQAVREGTDTLQPFVANAAGDRVADLARLTKNVPPLQRGAFALVGARVVQGTSAPPIDDATVVVREGRIEAVGLASTTPVPQGVPRVDARGKTIIPGLWDMHAHASQPDWAPVYLASGVTTIRDLGGDNTFLVAMRNAVRSGEALGPRYLLAGLVDGPGPRAFGEVTAATPDEGRTVVRRYRADGFEQIKIYSLVSPDVVRAIVEEAHQLGMTVTGHVPSGMTAQSAVEAGFDSLAHMQLRGSAGSDALKEQIAFFKQHGTVMDPTISWNELGGRPAGVSFESFLPGMWRLPLPLKRMFESMPGSNADPATWRARSVESAKALKEAVDAGLLVVAGTDKGVPGLSLHRELELYVDGGMTPLQALQTATIMPARAMKLDRELGTIEAGKRADLVVLDGNPLERIANIRRVRWVVANGHLYETTALWRAAGFAAAPGAPAGGRH